MLDLCFLFAEVSTSTDMAAIDVEQRKAFFSFISLQKPAETDSGKFSFGMLCSRDTFKHEETLVHLQLNLFNAWVDKLRILPVDATKAVLTSLPNALCLLDVLRTVAFSV